MHQITQALLPVEGHIQPQFLLRARAVIAPHIEIVLKELHQPERPAFQQRKQRRCTGKTDTP